ncbi:MAG: phosphoglucomutase/phosphomannomutase family protein, partial [Saprospiraceae bacterium]
MTIIKFGTDGWRAIIAEDYTIENIRRVATGTALWMKSKNMKQLVIGHDCRFGGRMFLEETAIVIASHGIKVLMAEGFVSTPMVSLGVIQHKADLGIVITASHNPASYNGYKLKSSYGGPTIPSEIAEVEQLIPSTVIPDWKAFSDYIEDHSIEIVNLEDDYFTHVKNNFNLDILRTHTKVAYDAMYGAGQRIMKKILPDLVPFHCEYNPGFNNTPPEPIAKNMTEISAYLANVGDKVGIAHDGDADRVAMLDE